MNESATAFSKEHILILNYILTITLLIYLPFIAITISGAFFSIIYNISDKLKHYEKDFKKSFAQELISTTIINKYISFALAILPILILAIIYEKIISIPNFRILYVWQCIFLLSSVGLFFLHYYKNSFERRDKFYLSHIFSGIFGLLLLIMSLKLIISLISLVAYPEEWLSLRSLFQLFLVPNFLSDYLLIILNGFLLMGGSTIFFAYCWKESRRYLLSKDKEGYPYRDFVRKFSLLIIIICSFIQPIIIIFYLYNLPDAFIFKNLLNIVIILILLAAVNLYSYLMLKDKGKNYSLRIVIMTLVIFEFILVNEHLGRAEVWKGAFEVLIAKGEEQEARRKIMKEAKEIRVEGERIYKERCVVCHSFDKKIVGPPYNEVIPKYDKDLNKLINFIRNPIKVNPSYPPMPQLGLREEEIKAVAEFLIEKTYKQLR